MTLRIVELFAGVLSVLEEGAPNRQEILQSVSQIWEPATKRQHAAEIYVQMGVNSTGRRVECIQSSRTSR